MKKTTTTASRISACVLATLSVAFAAYAEDPSGYAAHQTITFSGYTGTTTLTNFPALVKLPENLFKRPAHDDLALTDANGNRLAYEIDSVSGTNVLVWVRIPELSGNNTAITAWFGKARADVVDFATPDVWTNVYAAVWHMNSDETDATGLRLAQTAADTSRVHESEGLLGRALKLDENNHASVWLQTPYETFISQRMGDISKVTVSGWLNPSTTVPQNANDNVWRLFTWKAESGTQYGGFDTFQKNDGTLVVRGADKSKSFVTGTLNWETSTWNHLAVRYNGTSPAAWLNGASLGGSGEIAAVNTNFPSAMYYFGFGNMGGYQDKRQPQDLKYPFKNGQLDELRIYNGVASDDWIKAESDTVRSNDVFSAYGEIVVSIDPDFDRTWTNTTPRASWTNVSNWRKGQVANDSSVKALFESGNLPYQTVVVDSPVTVNAILQTDATSRIMTGEALSVGGCEVAGGGTLTLGNGYCIGNLVKTGTGTLELAPTSYTTPNAACTISVQEGTLTITDMTLPLEADCDFEPRSPLTGNGTNDRQKYYNNDYFKSNLTSWTFGTDGTQGDYRDSGIACNDSYYVNDDRIGLNGTYGHVALLRKLADNTIGPGFVSRTVTTDHDNATVVVRFQYNARGYKGGDASVDVWYARLGLLLDDDQIFDSGSFKSDRNDAVTKQWRTATVEIPVATAGSHTLKFTALDATWEENPVDSEVLLDNVSIGVNATNDEIRRGLRGVSIDIAAGAKLNIADGVAAFVRGCAYNGQKISGTISATTHPEFVIGGGSLEIMPGVMMFVR